MIFWILAILTVLIAIGVFITQWDDSYGMPFMGAFLTLIGGGAVTFFVVMLCMFIPTNHDLVSDDTYQLKAIGTNSAIEGRSYFLGGGYIKDKRVLNYISQRDGGAIHVEQAEAEDSTIYEGSSDATVRARHYDHVNGWVAPWPLGSHNEYEFRIPNGSVADSYTLDNK
jgi:hypothetical protein